MFNRDAFRKGKGMKFLIAFNSNVSPCFTLFIPPFAFDIEAIIVDYLSVYNSVGNDRHIR